MDEYTEVKSLANQAFYQEMNEAYGIQRGLVDSFGALSGNIYDAGEDLIEKLEDARDEVEDAEAEGEKTLAQAELDAIQAKWDIFLRAELEKADRKTIDSFGRLGKPSGSSCLKPWLSGILSRTSRLPWSPPQRPNRTKAWRLSIPPEPR